MDITQMNTSSDEQKPKSKKFFFWLVGIVAVSILLVLGFGLLKGWLGRYKIQRLAESLEQQEKESYARKMADTYGGKTPQETLRMYIEAVEKKDYALASKYFIERNQQKELDSWNGATTENIAKYIADLKSGLTAVGSYSDDGKEFVSHKPVLFDYSLYPNGIWKIVEI